jgi:hypothetical protein
MLARIVMAWMIGPPSIMIMPWYGGAMPATSLIFPRQKKPNHCQRFSGTSPIKLAAYDKILP